MNRRSFLRGILAGIVSVFGLVRPSKGQQPRGSSHVINIDGNVLPITNGPTFRDCEVTFRISIGSKCEGFSAWEKAANRIPSMNRTFSKVLKKIVAERKPLAPEVLADALQDRCHEDMEPTNGGNCK